MHASHAPTDCSHTEETAPPRLLRPRSQMTRAHAPSTVNPASPSCSPSLLFLTPLPRSSHLFHFFLQPEVLGDRLR